MARNVTCCAQVRERVMATARAATVLAALGIAHVTQGTAVANARYVPGTTNEFRTRVYRALRGRQTCLAAAAGTAPLACVRATMDTLVQHASLPVPQAMTVSRAAELLHVHCRTTEVCARALPTSRVWRASAAHLATLDPVATLRVQAKTTSRVPSTVTASETELASALMGTGVQNVPLAALVRPCLAVGMEPVSLESVFATRPRQLGIGKAPRATLASRRSPLSTSPSVPRASPAARATELVCALPMARAQRWARASASWDTVGLPARAQTTVTRTHAPRHTGARIAPSSAQAPRHPPWCAAATGRVSNRARRMETALATFTTRVLIAQLRATCATKSEVYVKK
eukprot:PhM_4_TR14658/c0_g1_i1/m.90781